MNNYIPAYNIDLLPVLIALVLLSTIMLWIAIKNYKNLASVISQRFRDVWSSVRHIEVHRGHLHSLKTNIMGQVEELSGIAVRHLGSMSATDQWHDDSGYMSIIKRAHAFVWHKTNGMQCEYYYNVPIQNGKQTKETT